MSVGDISRGGLQTGVAEVDPDARPCAQERIGRHEPHLGILFFQVFVDDRRLVNHALAVNQHGNLAVRIEFEEIFGLVGKVAFDQLIGELFFRQDNPCPVSVGSRLIGIEFHERLPSQVDSPPPKRFVSITARRWLFFADLLALIVDGRHGVAQLVVVDFQ